MRLGYLALTVAIVSTHHSVCGCVYPHDATWAPQTCSGKANNKKKKVKVCWDFHERWRGEKYLLKFWVQKQERHVASNPISQGGHAMLLLAFLLLVFSFPSASLFLRYIFCLSWTSLSHHPIMCTYCITSSVFNLRVVALFKISH